MLSPFIFTVLGLTSFRDVPTLTAFGISGADAKVFDQVVTASLSKSLPKTGSSAACKFVPSKVNPAFEAVIKKMQVDTKEFREILPSVDKELGSDANDLSFQLAVGITVAYGATHENGLQDVASDRLQKQIGYSLKANGWDKLSPAQKTTTANVAKALLFVEFVAAATDDLDSRRKISEQFLKCVFGPNQNLTVKDDWVENLVKSAEPKPPTSPAVSGKLMLAEVAGFQKADFSGSPGLTKAYPDYPGTTQVNFVLLSPSSASYENFKAAWDSAVPQGNTAQVIDLPFKRYVGNGIRATMGRGFAKNAKGESTNILVYNIENGKGSQALAGYFTHGGDLNKIVMDMEQVLAQINLPGAGSAPLASLAELAGTWTTHGASQMGYFSTSSGNLVGAAVVDRNVEYTFRADGTFSYEYTDGCDRRSRKSESGRR